MVTYYVGRNVPFKPKHANCENSGQLKMRHMRIPSILLASLAILAGSGPKSSAVDLFDSITGEATPYQAYSVSVAIDLSGATGIAQQFTSSTPNTVIDSLSLVIAKSAGATGTIDLAIYTTDSTNPIPTSTRVGQITQINVASLPLVGNSGGTLVINPSASAPTVPSVFSGLNTTLTNSGNYFVVLNNYTGGTGTIYWASWTGTAKTGSLEAVYFDAGWQNLGPTNPWLLKVSTAAVPEPSTWALMTIAAGTIAGIRYRRRQA